MRSITSRPLDDQEQYPYFYGVTLKEGDKYYEPDYDIDYEEFKKDYLTEMEWGIWEMHKIVVQTNDERILVEIVLNCDRLLPRRFDEDFDPNAPPEAAASKIRSSKHVKSIIDMYISEIENWENYNITQDIFEQLISYLTDNDKFNYFEYILELFPRNNISRRNDRSIKCEFDLLYLISDQEILQKILLEDKYHEFHRMVRKGLQID